MLRPVVSGQERVEKYALWLGRHYLISPAHRDMVGLEPRSNGRTTNVAQVLIADDEANLRKVLTALLKQDGHDATAVEDGIRALEVVERGDQLTE